jgi:hypothetical protein
VIVRRNASRMPTATNMPNTRTGGIGANASEANPTADVNDVYNIGVNRSSITARIVLRRSPI